MRPMTTIVALGLGTLLGVAVAQAQETIPPPPALGPVAVPEPAVAPVQVTAEQFLAQARRPFQVDLWARFSGDVRYRGEAVRQAEPIRLAMRLTAAGLRAEIVLGEKAVYRIEQTYAGDSGAVPKVTLQVPEGKVPLKLEDIGLRPEDVTFSFLYWKFVREWPEENVRGQDCRVLELVHPSKPETVRVWMAKAYAFPLRIRWYRQHEDVHMRSFEFTDFKRHGDFWFPTGMRLFGPVWKTMVTFGEAEIARPDEKPEPAGLFAKP